MVHQNILYIRRVLIQMVVHPVLEILVNFGQFFEWYFDPMHPFSKTKILKKEEKSDLPGLAWKSMLLETNLLFFFGPT